jgi:hypothetical protein
MSAPVLRLHEDTRTPEEAEARADNYITQCRRELIDAIRRGDKPADIKKLRESYERYALSGAQVYLRRARKCEKALRAVLGGNLSDEQAEKALSTIYGHPNERRRNPGGLSDNEQEQVDWYRSLDAGGRMALRELKRLTGGAR